MRIVLDDQLEAKVRMGEELPQRQKVLVLLRDAEGYGVCGTKFPKTIPRYSARIGELRKEGWTITKRKCLAPYHDHTTHSFEYVLGVPAVPTLFGEEGL